MKTKLISKNSSKLIIFLSGWGCDDVQFQNMTSKSDVFLCWDYSDLDFDFNFDKYETIDLIAYSAGVFVGGLIKDKLPKLNKRVAINGNLKMFDKYFGIPKNVLDLMSGLNLDNYMDFRRNYLVISDEELEYFNKNSSIRTFESCSFELKKLQEYYSNADNLQFEYDKAILSDSDKIFNPQHQIEYYKDEYILLKNRAHDIFFTFKDFDEIVDQC
jgi:malonyl-CoA O-methyltransferase/biotin synthesis protein BioG